MFIDRNCESGNRTRWVPDLVYWSRSRCDRVDTRTQKVPYRIPNCGEGPTLSEELYLS